MVCLLPSYKAHIYLVSRLSRMPVRHDGGVIYNARQVASSATLSCTLEADKMVFPSHCPACRVPLAEKAPCLPSTAAFLRALGRNTKRFSMAIDEKHWTDMKILPRDLVTVQIQARFPMRIFLKLQMVKEMKIFTAKAAKRSPPS